MYLDFWRFQIIRCCHFVLVVDSASDLASVKKILDAAIQPFRSFPIDNSNLSGKSEDDSMDYSMEEDRRTKDLEEPPVLSPRSKGDTSSSLMEQDMPEIAESPEQFAKTVRVHFRFNSFIQWFF